MPIGNADPPYVHVSRPSTPAPYRHSRYYIQDEMVIFRVEGCLYKTHKYFFTFHPGFFQDMFSLPQPSEESNPVEGTTDDTAIYLPDVTCSEFDALLDFFYRRQNVQNESPTLEHWTALLSISTRFQYDEIRTQAIKEIDAHGESSMTPVDKIVLAEKYSVTEWLSPSYYKVCQRRESLTDLDALRLGAVTTARLARAREDVRRQAQLQAQVQTFTGWGVPAGIPTAVPEAGSKSDPYDEALVKEVVNQIFWPEPEGKKLEPKRKKRRHP